MLKIAIIAGTTRPGRKSDQVAAWVLDHAKKRGDAEYAVLDLAAINLPLFDEPLPPLMGKFQHEHTKAWAATLAGFDGFVFVTTEYNHGIPAALKNAIDFAAKEWNNKAAGFVSYGSSAGGVRAVEHLRAIMGQLQIADVQAEVNLFLMQDFENRETLKPQPHREKALDAMLGQLTAWAGALKPMRGG